MPRFNETAFTLKRLMGTMDPRIKITVIEETPEAPPTKPDRFYNILEESILESIPDAEVVPYLFVASSDNSYFRSCGIPTYGLMPIEMSKEMIESVHSTNEHIPIKALNEGIQIYFNFLTKAIHLNCKNEKRRLFNRDH
jgi:acetylornithine deacetylase/succinyl-diaminopimelate desuccinylase-like protein